MLAAPSSPHRPDHSHDHGHAEHEHHGHAHGREHAHDHSHSHGHSHTYENAAPRKVRSQRIRSLIALSGGQRLLLVLPLIGGLWLATLWAMS